MERDEGLDQFQLLEEKVDYLIRFIEAFKKEKETFIEKNRIQEDRIADLMSEMKLIKGARDKAKQKISSLLAKIEQLDI
jgi:regulator of replication initiation timing